MERRPSASGKSDRGLKDRKIRPHSATGAEKALESLANNGRRTGRNQIRYMSLGAFRETVPATTDAVRSHIPSHFYNEGSAG
jgi:hypothetical protein